MKKKNSDYHLGSILILIAGILLSLIGLLLPSSFLMMAGIAVIVLSRSVMLKKAMESDPHRGDPQQPPAAADHSSQPRPVKPVRPEGWTAPRRSGDVSYNSYARDHYHITDTGISAERRLEQLEVMKNAGLIDKEEYQRKRQEILRDK